MRRSLTAALAALALLAPVAPASGDDEYVYTSEAPATDGLLYEAVRKADEFWQSKGVQPGPVLLCVFDDTESAARANLNGRKVWFERSFVRMVRDMIRDKQRAVRRAGYESLFRTATHERGHNLGLRHEDGGIMGENPNTPGIGVAWAREKAR